MSTEHSFLACKRLACRFSHVALVVALTFTCSHNERKRTPPARIRTESFKSPSTCCLQRRARRYGDGCECNRRLLRPRLPLMLPLRNRATHAGPVRPRGGRRPHLEPRPPPRAASPAQSRATRYGPIQTRQLGALAAALPHRTMNASAGIRPAPIPHPAREGGLGLRPPLGSPAAALRRARPPLSDLGRAPEQIFTQGTKVVIPPARSLSNLSSNLHEHAAAGGVALLEGGLMIGG